MSAQLRPVPPFRAPRPSRRERLAAWGRQARVFGVGFLSGAIALFVALLATGGLKPPEAWGPGAPLAKMPAANRAPVRPEARPTVPPGPLPRLPGDSTDAAVATNPFARPAELWTSPAAMVTDLEHLREHALTFPVEGFDLHRLRDNFAEMRGDRVHEAIDIPAPRGTPVLAADEGPVQKLFVSARGGLTVYQFDRTGQYCYYYAHLDRYAEGLREGQWLKKGDRVGYVGTSGNAPPNVPHLHFTIFRLGADRHWWEGTAVNPFPLWALAR
jgi:peptidoglycan LD-endopeptidase LytH